MNSKRIILAITGASGSMLAIEFLKLMQENGVEVHGMISDAGRKVLELEEGRTWDAVQAVDRPTYSTGMGVLIMIGAKVR